MILQRSLWILLPIICMRTPVVLRNVMMKQLKILYNLELITMLPLRGRLYKEHGLRLHDVRSLSESSTGECWNF